MKVWEKSVSGVTLIPHTAPDLQSGVTYFADRHCRQAKFPVGSNYYAEQLKPSHRTDGHYGRFHIQLALTVIRLQYMVLIYTFPLEL